ncbi:TPA: hypothetical protein DEP34_03450 [Candidatus Uhrbacteria bacterium]|uniref:Uncharacterized protein n=2 Tax=Candidatus Uhriibacteriota TaxID=1752732 RepID=A0A0G1Q910_9BACT|nr:MAG: hypothetical protein UX45_C0009G0010 [Candidatus Uhrbacteria bacterium GW2011_GWF2_46_218]KKU41307.1 MAG: hypothetical protein UX57_C0004G0011 [Candidatus Uhrbacteria bacterium GW2011_GWE2_46_68]HBK33744.1 hypothetical protein [Candidatus Uhrbacteria bacterium]HCB19415.1 hypothetical protein [Candidatus Uhrbacteria bacterium]
MDFSNWVYFHSFSHEVEKEISEYSRAIKGDEWRKTSAWFAIEFLIFCILLFLTFPGTYLQDGTHSALFLVSFVSTFFVCIVLCPRLFRASLEIFGGDVRHLVLRKDRERVHDPLLKIGHQIKQLRELLEPIAKEWNDYVDCLRQGYDRDPEMDAIELVLQKLRALIKEMVEELNVLIKMKLKEKNDQEIFVDLHEVTQRLEELRIQICAVKETLAEMDGLKVPQGAAVRSVRIDEAVASLTGQLSEAERIRKATPSLRAKTIRSC